MPRADRLAIAARRLRRVLTTHTVAHARTLEQKISDAGPGHLRVDPHLLTEARRDLITAQEIALIPDEHGAWFSLSTTPLPEVRGRLAVLRPLHNRFVAPAVSQRTGQALEIAVFRALSTQQRLGFLGAFRDLDDHDDATPYSKVEPPSHLSGRSIPNDRSLDFIAGDLLAPLGIEVKNLRPWLYPQADEIKDFLLKCCALDAVPVLIARRIAYVTFGLFHPCGVIFHQTYNQRLAHADAALAEQASRRDLLGYHDIRVGNQPDARLIKFLHHNLPAIAPAARQKFNACKELLRAYATGAMSYEEFAGRAPRRAARPGA